MNFTKINLEQLENLSSALSNARNDITSGLANVKNNLSTIKDAGYMKGIAENALESQLEIITKLVNDYSDYAERLINKITEIREKSETIDKEEATKDENVYEQDPTTYSKKTTETNKKSDAEKTATTENKEKSKNSSNDLSTPAHTEGMYLSGKSSSNGYGPEFLNKVKRIAADHGMNYKELLALMNSESGINSKCDNGVGYVGLMQWGSTAASQMGTTQSQLKNMTPVEQLDYVDKSLTLMEDGGFVPKQGATAADYYAANFLPYRAKNGDVLTNKNEGYYQQNKGLDVNKDGYITKSDLDQRMKKCYVDEASFTNN